MKLETPEERINRIIETEKENFQLCLKCARGGRWKSPFCVYCVRNGSNIDHFIPMDGDSDHA